MFRRYKDFLPESFLERYTLETSDVSWDFHYKLQTNYENCALFKYKLWFIEQAVNHIISAQKHVLSAQ